MGKLQEIVAVIRNLQDYEIAQSLSAKQLKTLANALGIPVRGNKLEMAVEIKTSLDDVL